MAFAHGLGRDASFQKPDSWRWEMAAAGVVLLACISIFSAISSNPDAHGLYTALSSAVRAIGVACIARALWLHRPQYRLVWLLLLARFAWSALFVPLRNAYIDNLVWWAVDGAIETIFYIAAAAILVHARSAGQGRSLWIDVLVICLAVTLVLFAYVGSPLVSKDGLSALTIITAVVVPSLDVILIALTLLLIFTWRDRNIALALIICALLLVPAADIAIDLAQLGILNISLTHNWLPIGQISVALTALAALHPSMRSMQKPAAQDPESWDRPRAALIVAAFLFALGGLVIPPEVGRIIAPALIAGVLATMFLLIVWRASLAMRALNVSRERIHFLATHDSPTGLPNFLGLTEAHQRARARQPGTRSLLLLRLSQMHEIGQLWGLALRDAWVRHVAAAIATATAGKGQLGRVGNDQFALLTDAGADDADIVAGRMAAALHGMQSDIDPAIVSSFDIGIAHARGDVSLQIMLREAESALTIAHAHGQNRIAHYDATVAAAEHRRLALLTRLHNAVERKEFSLHFQPIVDLATREVVSHEALLRWHAADLGDVSPVEFIPLAESTDAIESITDWVLDNACAVLAASGRSTARGYRMSVNISAPSLQRPGLARRVVMALDRHRLSPKDLCLELTERAQMDDPHGELSALRARGVALAIDDFGSGYSNLEMLALLPADTLKLDIQFVRAIEAQSTMRDLCQSLLAHVERHGTRVIAEGIETEGQHDLLCRLGCHYGQGWLYGRPSPQLDRRRSARIGLGRARSA